VSPALHAALEAVRQAGQHARAQREARDDAAREHVTAEPIAGFYQTRLVKGGPWVPVRLWFGPPLDPHFPRLLDRAPCWQACANGRRFDVDRLWPWCARHPISRSRYRYLIARHRWAVRWNPAMPEADPYRPIDPNTTPILI